MNKYTYLWVDSNSTCALYETDTFGYDSQHNLAYEMDTYAGDNVTYEGFGASYNSYHQSLIEDFYSNYEPLDSAHDHWRFVYELYTPPLSAGKVATKECTMTLYPSPANNAITLGMELDQQEKFTIVIYDRLGRQCAQYGATANGGFQKTIPVSNLPNGNYTLSVRGNGMQGISSYSAALTNVVPPTDFVGATAVIGQHTSIEPFVSLGFIRKT